MGHFFSPDHKIIENNREVAIARSSRQSQKRLRRLPEPRRLTDVFIFESEPCNYLILKECFVFRKLDCFRNVSFRRAECNGAKKLDEIGCASFKHFRDIFARTKRTKLQIYNSINYTNRTDYGLSQFICNTFHRNKNI